MLSLERSYYSVSVSAIVGIDEAGRGPLAGPVFAAAVLFPIDFVSEEIDDSKKLSPKKREELFPLIIDHALAYGIASVSAEQIDRLNIYEATKVCMKKALAQIEVPYQLVITDAMPLSGLRIPVVPIIRGDGQCLNVAAASILAKVSRDHFMVALGDKYPQYGFAHHKGYGTKEHLEALRKYGPIEGIHRKTFRPVVQMIFPAPKLF
jgi:ribonuclease HII